MENAKKTRLRELTTALFTTPPQIAPNATKAFIEPALFLANTSLQLPIASLTTPEAGFPDAKNATKLSS